MKETSVNSFIKWTIGILGGIAGTSVLIISSFYLSVLFNPLHLLVDFGTKSTCYGTFGQFADTPATTILGSETLELVHFKNIGLVVGYSKKTNDDPAGRKGRWQLTGFEGGDYVVAAYEHIEGDNQRVGVYFLKKSQTATGSEFYRGHLVEEDSSGVIAVCPYVLTNDDKSLDDIESMYPAIKSPCTDTTKLNLDKSR
jgi:hypothetical protein